MFAWLGLVFSFKKRLELLTYSNFDLLLLLAVVLFISLLFPKTLDILLPVWSSTTGSIVFLLGTVLKLQEDVDEPWELSPDFEVKGVVAEKVFGDNCF